MAYDYETRSHHKSDRYTRRHASDASPNCDSFAVSLRHPHEPKPRHVSSSHALVVRRPSHSYVADSISTRGMHRRFSDHSQDKYHNEHRYDEYHCSHGPTSASSSVHRRKSSDHTDMLVAVVLGAGIAAGGKEIYDRHEAEEDSDRPQRNLLASAALAAAGGLVAYQGVDMYKRKKGEEEERSQHGQASEFHDTKHVSRRDSVSLFGNTLDASGLVAAAKKLANNSTGDWDANQDRHEHSYHNPEQGSNTKQNDSMRIQKAAVASLLAGATEAFRVASSPGEWQGEKGKRVAMAALGAGAIDSVRGPEKQKHRKLSIAESVIGGLVTNRMINGSKSQLTEEHETKDERRRSSGRDRKHSPSRRRRRDEEKVDGNRGRITAPLAATATSSKKLLSNSRAESRSEKKRNKNKPQEDYEDGMAYGEDSSCRQSYSSSRSRSRSKSRGRHHGRHSFRRSESAGRHALTKLGITTSPDSSRDRHEQHHIGFSEYSNSNRHSTRRRSSADYHRDDHVYTKTPPPISIPAEAPARDDGYYSDAVYDEDYRQYHHAQSPTRLRSE
ncbi:hypothetical protein Cpir12675_001415 [Ceratocystis pirilliformis]|uniref:DUF3824 domain-containing protein n=1 Tax=Ceratocystis pirilliformis TaxID=259994 RepID=A0ABR3ZG75_9PEZI